MIHLIGKGAPKQLQQLGREEMKQKLLNDILIDMQVCIIEGRDIREYTSELKSLIDEIFELLSSLEFNKKRDGKTA